ncbi:MAG: ribosome maturation factor RimM [Verrucomicrobiaceae bacterium]|nr:ribosome maturation factor RimM [Verrucomicrobiaceae bacterium]
MSVLSADSVPDDLVVIGRLTGVYGVKGWLKLFSYTDPMENFFGYQRCQIFRQGAWQQLAIADGRQHGKGLVVKLRDVDDRDQAAAFVGCDIVVPAEDLPQLAADDFYWRELEGLQVVVDDPERGRLILGKVNHLLETGANDVLVVKGDDQSIDQRERLIPYLPDQVVLKVDLPAQTIVVAWDPDF